MLRDNALVTEGVGSQRDNLQRLPVTFAVATKKESGAGPAQARLLLPEGPCLSCSGPSAGKELPEVQGALRSALHPAERRPGVFVLLMGKEHHRQIPTLQETFLFWIT